VIVTGTKQAGSHGQANLDRRSRRQPELSEVEYRLVLFRSRKAHEVIDYFGDPESCERHVFVGLHKLLDLRRGWFILEEREDGIGVENNHLRRSPAASSTLD
jgi:hypothetical protein